MRKAPSEKSVQFCELQILEDPKESQEPEEITEPRCSTRQTEIAAGRMFVRRPEFPYRGILTQKPVVEVPPLPAKYFKAGEPKNMSTVSPFPGEPTA